MNMISTIGLDIAKNSFSVHGFNAEGMTVLTKELKRGIAVTLHSIALG